MNDKNSEIGSMLTPSQRERLTDADWDMNSSSGRSVKARVRRRLRAGVIDCYTILRGMDINDIETALAVDREDYVRLDNGAAGAIGILYLAYRDRPSNRDSTTRSFEKRAENGIRMALNQLGESVESVNVTVEIETGEEFDELDENNLPQYTETTLLQAKQAGAIGADQFISAIEAKDADSES